MVVVVVVVTVLVAAVATGEVLRKVAAVMADVGREC